MKTAIRPTPEDDLLAELTDIAYRALLRQGLQRPFVEVELELWEDIRDAYRNVEARYVRTPESALCIV